MSGAAFKCSSLSFFFCEGARAKLCLCVCLLCLGAVQRIACDELVLW